MGLVRVDSEERGAVAWADEEVADVRGELGGRDVWAEGANVEAQGERASWQVRLNLGLPLSSSTFRLPSRLRSERRGGGADSGRGERTLGTGLPPLRTDSMSTESEHLDDAGEWFTG